MEEYKNDLTSRLSSVSTSACPSFIIPEVLASKAPYTASIHLTVNDGYLTSIPSSISVFIKNLNRPPTAYIIPGSNIEIYSEEELIIEGSGSDLDSDTELNYLWTCDSNFIIDGGDLTNLDLTSPATESSSRVVTPKLEYSKNYNFNLHVNDGEYTDIATVKVTVYPIDKSINVTNPKNTLFEYSSD
ncbi:MAG: hypothetical protein H8E13_18700 [Actinobacteria bacterium]|nr:hypothetical protein [Actinomycetota bacterium]